MELRSLNKIAKTPGTPFLLAFTMFAMSFVLVGSCNTGSGSNNSTNNTFSFTDVTNQSGLSYTHSFQSGGPANEPQRISGGVAAGDYDNDGWVDLYAIAGDGGTNLLFRNLGNGTFQNVANSAGVAVSGVIGAGPTFADYDGDGHLDLFIGGVLPLEQVQLFKNNGDGTFSDSTAESMLDTVPNFTLSQRRLVIMIWTAISTSL